jgi:hypothetical protein
MRTKIFTLSLIVLFSALLLANSAQAMSSTNYALNWFTPGTSGGGGPMNSAHYAVNITIGQSAIGNSASANYGVGLGYWYGVGADALRFYLPFIRR